MRSPKLYSALDEQSVKSSKIENRYQMLQVATGGADHVSFNIPPNALTPADQYSLVAVMCLTDNLALDLLGSEDYRIWRRLIISAVRSYNDPLVANNPIRDGIVAQMENWGNNYI